MRDNLCPLSVASVLLPALAIVLALFAPAGALAGGLYNSIPSPLPGNVLSLGYEAAAVSEAGDHIAFAGGGGGLTTVDVVMSSQGCQTGGGTTCSTTPGSGFMHPITFNIYAVDDGGAVPAVGALIASSTQTFFIPYRPSADLTHCSTGSWFDGSRCFGGKAVVITFDFSALGITLPAEVIYGLAFNTSHRGYSPIGESAACFPHCGYDSLNFGVVGTSNGQPTVGTDVEGETIFWSTTSAGSYCDGGAGGTGTFRRDAGCWTDPANTFAVRFPGLPFRDVRRAGEVNAGPALGGTGHTAINFTGAAGSAGDTWISVYDTSSGETTPTTFTGSVSLSADVLIHKANNKKGAGLLALYNEGPAQKGLALVLYDNGNADQLVLSTVDQAGKLTALQTVSLGTGIVLNQWYRLTMVVTVSGADFSVTGKVFKHATASDPDSAVAVQVGGTLSQPSTSLAGKNLLSNGEVGVVASAISAVVDSSVANFVVVP